MIIYLIIGINIGDGDVGFEQVSVMQNALSSTYNISLWSLLIPVLVIALIIKKVPAIPALFIGTIAGGLYAVFFQAELIFSLNEYEIGNSLSYLKNAYMSVMNAMTVDIEINTGNSSVDSLVSTGGMSGMLNTIWLIVCAMSFGGIMEVTGFLSTITSSLLYFVKSRKSLVLTTSSTCMFLNVTASDQYLAIVVPGRMFADSYEKYGLHPKNLSRTLEDTATVTSPLVPWNTCGATHAGVLGISTLVYLPYCFFNLISPIMTLTFAYLSIKIAKSNPVHKFGD